MYASWCSCARLGITTICDGTERITKTALEAIQLDHLAENQNGIMPT